MTENGARALGCVFAVVAILGAACGDDDAVDTGSADTATSVADDGGPAEDSAATVEVGETSLGSVLVDADGMTLYLFTPDDGGEPTCEGSCAELWPPVLDDDPEPAEGVDASLLGTVERSDGESQVTYAGHPLYRYAQDDQPGDVKGQGVNDVWFAIAPDGTAVEEGSPAPGDDGY